MNFLKRLRNDEMKLRDYGWVLEIAFLRLAGSLLLCWGGDHQMLASQSKSGISRNPSKRNRNQISYETWGAHSQT